MSGPFEQYVEQATKAVMAANYMAADEVTEGLVRADVQLAIAAVGPLIAEDTRDRMVAAAGAALEREGGGNPDSGLAAVRKLHAADFVPQPSQFSAWCTECNCAWPCTTAKILEGQP